MTATPRPVFLIGAARSGTKILRDVLAQAAQVGAVPYDVNFVWKYGHQTVPHDVLDPARAGERQRRFVRRYLARYQAGRPSVVIEKTVGNSLRVPYVHALFPDAAFVHLVRDGVDAVESSRRQWQAPPDRRYLLEKVRHFPVRMLPTYGVSFARAQLPSRHAGESRVRSWGVRYPGIDRDVREESLLTVCARQWARSVASATEAFDQLSLPVVQVRYEELVAAPVAQVGRILDELAVAAPARSVDAAAARLVAGRAGTGSSALSPPELEELQQEIGPALRDLGYRPASEPRPW